ncbi:hypothetical protein BC832DRAFT_543962 [Gaertneriomyces semiglobifer]|nr:hypothetical protein BC832DRAFT_543962 [Gaertneriomyces semiglobifer]
MHVKEPNSHLLANSGGALAATVEYTVSGSDDCTAPPPTKSALLVTTMTVDKCWQRAPDLSTVYSQLQMSDDDVSTYKECTDSACTQCISYSCPVGECCAMGNVYFTVAKSSARSYAPSMALMALIGTVVLSLSL